MSLLEKLKSDKISAMKEKNIIKKNILSTLIGEIEREKKSSNEKLNDSDIIKIIKKLVENNKLTNNLEENEYIEIYLPNMLSTLDLERIINNIIKINNLEGVKSMGLIMKELNQNYPGEFDGKTASIIAKKILL